MPECGLEHHKLVQALARLVARRIGFGVGDVLFGILDVLVDCCGVNLGGWGRLLGQYCETGRTDLGKSPSYYDAGGGSLAVDREDAWFERRDIGRMAGEHAEITGFAGNIDLRH